MDSPGTYKELREEPTLISKAIEEVLRYRFPITLARRITEDTNIFGPLMKKGSNGGCVGKCSKFR